MSLTLSGALDLSLDGDAWRIKHQPPLYLNFLKRDKYFRAMPTDQSGGLRCGDMHDVKISLRNRANLHWQSAQSTLVIPSGKADDEPARLRTEIFVENSHLTYISPPTIPFAGTRFEQQMTIHVSGDSEFLYWEVFSPGRTGSGESWQFVEFENLLQVNLEGACIYRERMVLKRNEIPLSHAGFSDARLWVTGIAVGAASLRRLYEVKDHYHRRGIEIQCGKINEICGIAKGIDSTGEILGGHYPWQNAR